MIFTQNNEQKIRLDRFLSANLNVSRSQIAQLIAKNAVQINGKTASKSGILLKTNDKIYIKKNVDLLDSRESALDSPSIAEGARGWVKSHESNDNSQDSRDFLPEITRIYEDNDILVLNKPPFLATHGAPSLKEKSLVDWLKAHKIQLSSISGEKREGIIHRLDKQTSGAIVVAKNNRAHRLLSAQLSDKSMGRIYLAIIDLPLKSDIEVECYLARNPKNRLKISKVALKDSRIWGKNHSIDSAIPRGARYAKSKFFKLATSNDGTKELICAKLFTGRTHQIRAHLESLNRHIIGDELYGYKANPHKYRVMLHSYLLYLTHPKDFGSGNLSLGMRFRTCENFWDFADSKSSLNPKNSHKYKTRQSRSFFIQSHTANTSIADSANTESSKNQSCDSTLESRPIRGAKNREKGYSSASADFLLEAEKRGSPPKSEKWQLLGTQFNSRGERVRGAALLRKEKSESNKQNNKSIAKLTHPLRHPNARERESQLDSRTKNPKILFLAPLFDDMQVFLAQNFDMEKIDEILRKLPNRFGF